MTIAMILTTAISLGFFGAGLLVANQIGEMKEIYYDKVQVSIYLADDVTDAAAGAPVKTAAGGVAGGRELPVPDQGRRRSSGSSSCSAATRSWSTQATPEDAAGDVPGPDEGPGALHGARRAVPGRARPASTRCRARASSWTGSSRCFNGIRNATIALALLQALAALLLISNTIQVAAFNRRTETGIMRLVGASRWYTQLPFVLEAALAGLVGAVLAIGGLVAAKFLFVDKTLAEPIRSGIVPPIDVGTILMISPSVAGVGVLLAASPRTSRCACTYGCRHGPRSRPTERRPTARSSRPTARRGTTTRSWTPTRRASC